MTAQEAVTQSLLYINAEASSFAPAIELNAVNSGINKICVRRVRAKDAEFIFPVAVVNGQSQPADFMGFAGTNPIEIRDLGTDRKWYYTGSVQPTVKYFRNRPNVTALTDEVQLPYRWQEALVLWIAIRLNETRGYNMDKDRADFEDMTA